jgi:hypothetical protein
MALLKDINFVKHVKLSFPLEAIIVENVIIVLKNLIIIVHGWELA